MARTWPPAKTRPWPAPPSDAPLLIGIGDLHHGWTDPVRLAKALEDLLRLPVPAAYVVIGDLTQWGSPAEEAAAIAWLDALPAPWYGVYGNHDGFGGRTGAAFAAAYGLPGRNYSVDLGFVQLVCIAPDTYNPPFLLTADDLSWLGSTLTAATKDCLIACHYPLYDTAVGPTSGAGQQWSSVEAGFYIEPVAELLALLDDHEQAIAWLAGHTHTDLSAPGLLKSVDLGSHPIAAINLSAPAYTGRTAEPHDPITAFCLSHYADRLEVRPRSLGGVAWATVAGQRVTTFPF